MTMNLNTARASISGARDFAAEAKFKPLTYVVLDVGGHVVAVEREDGPDSGTMADQSARVNPFGEASNQGEPAWSESRRRGVLPTEGLGPFTGGRVRGWGVPHPRTPQKRGIRMIREAGHDSTRSAGCGNPVS